MTRRLFDRISAAVMDLDPYSTKERWSQQVWTIWTPKITAALRQMAQGIGADSTNEYCRLAESIARKSLYRFCKAIQILYEAHYSWKPNSEDFARLLTTNEQRGFSGMLAS